MLGFEPNVKMLTEIGKNRALGFRISFLYLYIEFEPEILWS